MTPLRQRMINDMSVRGLANSTMAAYLRSVTGTRPALSPQPRADLRARSPGLPPVPSPAARIELADLQHRSPRRTLFLPHHP